MIPILLLGAIACLGFLWPVPDKIHHPSRSGGIFAPPYIQRWEVRVKRPGKPDETLHEKAIVIDDRRSVWK